MRIALGIPLVLLALATSVRGQEWTAQRVLTLGEDAGYEFAMISSIAPARDGSFFVLDSRESRVYHFTRDGKLIRSFGKRGGGPGELSRHPFRVVVLGDRLIVIDPLNQRINTFEFDGTFVRSRALSMGEMGIIHWAAVGNRIAYAPQAMPSGLASQIGGVTRPMLLALDPATDTPPDTLLPIDLRRQTDISMGSTIKVKLDMRVPQILVAGSGNSLLLATSDTYRIRVLDARGRTTGWLSRDFQRRRFSKSELNEMKRMQDSIMQSNMRRAGAGGRSVPLPEIETIMPEFAPAIAWLTAGDRYVLVTPGDGEKDRHPGYDVLGYDNRYLGKLKLPKGFGVLAVQGDRAYGIEQDEFDVPSVVVYRILPPKKTN